ncbi:hypothetical protein [Pseudoclavibacter sp. VKM Ac-2888]|uniref:hypothetical protein n=1 Tax=Pseudoclavibacter sp. VKM Ac-2888 TaxID=2783830 RepID=UPI00188C9026|nr:hypothetical protein [Pseudoclavibacter sp. VKM Ac-2888]MBF4549241.1 hypothetical protein [Pseudoclavibacter sp. VKM Ac-2888]
MATRAKTTTLDDDTTKPSVTEPGDGPADTTDPTEIATSVTPLPPSEEAIAAGTQNAVLPVEKPSVTEAPESEHRIEHYDAVRPDGSTVRVKHNLDTGKTEIVEAETPAETPPTTPAA